MSDEVTWIVDMDASPGDAVELGRCVTNWLIDQRIVSRFPCKDGRGRSILARGDLAARWDEREGQPVPAWSGLEVIARRHVFHTGENGIDSIECPTCGVQHPPDNVPWANAVAAWFAGEANDELMCPACGAKVQIVAWQFDKPWGFSQLAFGFWNWQIKEALLAAVSEFTGHRCIFVYERV